MQQLRNFLIVVTLTAFLRVHGTDKPPAADGSYEFGFSIDGQQFRHEKKDANGIIKGEFGFITADGVFHVTVYATDEQGHFKILSMKNIHVNESSAIELTRKEALLFSQNGQTSQKAVTAGQISQQAVTASTHSYGIYSPQTQGTTNNAQTSYYRPSLHQETTKSAHNLYPTQTPRVGTTSFQGFGFHPNHATESIQVSSKKTGHSIQFPPSSQMIFQETSIPPLKPIVLQPPEGSCSFCSLPPSSKKIPDITGLLNPKPLSNSLGFNTRVHKPMNTTGHIVTSTTFTATSAITGHYPTQYGTGQTYNNVKPNIALQGYTNQEAGFGSGSFASSHYNGQKGSQPSFSEPAFGYGHTFNSQAKSNGGINYPQNGQFNIRPENAFGAQNQIPKYQYNTGQNKLQQGTIAENNYSQTGVTHEHAPRNGKGFAESTFASSSSYTPQPSSFNNFEASFGTKQVNSLQYGTKKEFSLGTNAGQPYFSHNPTIHEQTSKEGKGYPTLTTGSSYNLDLEDTNKGNGQKFNGIPAYSGHSNSQKVSSSVEINSNLESFKQNIPRVSAGNSISQSTVTTPGIVKEIGEQANRQTYGGIDQPYAIKDFSKNQGSSANNQSPALSTSEVYFKENKNTEFALNHATMNAYPQQGFTSTQNHSPSGSSKNLPSQIIPDYEPNQQNDKTNIPQSSSNSDTFEKNPIPNSEAKYSKKITTPDSNQPILNTQKDKESNEGQPKEEFASTPIYPQPSSNKVEGQPPQISNFVKNTGNNAENQASNQPNTNQSKQNVEGGNNYVQSISTVQQSPKSLKPSFEQENKETSNPPSLLNKENSQLIAPIKNVGNKIDHSGSFNEMPSTSVINDGEPKISEEIKGAARIKSSEHQDNLESSSGLSQNTLIKEKPVDNTGVNLTPSAERDQTNTEHPSALSVPQQISNKNNGFKEKETPLSPSSIQIDTENPISTTTAPTNLEQLAAAGEGNSQQNKATPYTEINKASSPNTRIQNNPVESGSTPLEISSHSPTSTQSKISTSSSNTEQKEKAGKSLPQEDNSNGNFQTERSVTDSHPSSNQNEPNQSLIKNIPQEEGKIMQPELSRNSDVDQREHNPVNQLQSSFASQNSPQFETAPPTLQNKLSANNALQTGSLPIEKTEQNTKQHNAIAEPSQHEAGQIASLHDNEQLTKKPRLISAQMQIVDKNTDIHHRAPGENEGLPRGISQDYMLRVLYTFNYTVGFHGHFEEGYSNGAKKGYYYVTGRNGVKTRVDYTADETGFHPKVSEEVLDILSDEVPKPETEKDAKYGLKSYEFKWLYFPVESKVQ